jgi:hypothetical protein
MAGPRYDVRKQVGWAATGGTEAFYRTFDVGLDTVETEIIDNGNFVGDYQSEAPRPGSSRGVATFSCQLEGGTAADAAPVHDPLINACGFDVDTVGGISLWHLGDTHSTGGEIVAADLKVNLDGLQTEIVQAVGNVVFTFEAGKIPIMAFTMAGLIPSGAFAGATEVAISALTAQSTPAAAENYSLAIGPDGAAVSSLVCPKVVIDPQNTIDIRRDLNGGHGYSQPQIPERSPLYTFTLEAPVLATLNLESNYLSRGLYDFNFTHNAAGTTNQVLDVSGSGYIVEYPRKVNHNGVVAYEVKVKQASAEGILAMQWS